jgi:DNA-binding MarR family transcriptional regulator
MIRFPDFLDKRAWRSTTTVPSHQRLMQVLAAAGGAGLTRAEIGGLIDLDNGTLDDLLNALIRGGEVAMSHTKDGRRIYCRLT